MTVQRQYSYRDSFVLADPKVLRDEVLNILLAGRDTTTNTLSYGIYMLSKHPDVLKRLRQEVLETVGESRRPDFEDMRSMKYMRAFINGEGRSFLSFCEEADASSRNPASVPRRTIQHPVSFPPYDGLYSMMTLS